jgi:hypothetical protein
MPLEGKAARLKVLLIIDHAVSAAGIEGCAEVANEGQYHGNGKRV